MIFDSYFRIGDGHQVCEDYAAHGENYAIVSDGCSAGEQSDWGARLYTVLAARLLSCTHLQPTDDTFYKFINRSVRAKLIELGLPKSANLASLGILTKQSASLFGDGSIVLVKNNGNIVHIEIEYDNNSPFYPCYLDLPTTASYFNDTWHHRTVTTTTYATSRIYKDEEKLTTIETGLYTVHLDKDVVKSFVFSDGLTSFTTPSGFIPHTTELIRELILSKLTTHGFIQRRSKRFFKQYCVEKDIRNHDDFSIGAMLDV